MSGHSKWATIKRKKGALDAKRGKVFSKLAKEIAVAAKVGGSDPAGNPRLRTVLLAAKAQNMPKDNVDRAIKKGAGEMEGVNYEEIRYEGYGPASVAIIIDVLTDHKNRTVSEVRHILTKHGGSMAAAGAVTWNFEPKGAITVSRDSCSTDEIFEKAVEAGAEDVDTEGDSYEIVTAPTDLHTVSEALQGMGLKVENAQLTMTPKTTVKVDKKDASTVFKVIEALEDNDDVQNVYANFDVSAEVMAELAGE